MKISKLFHWLYGALMLLPILVFIPNAFYYGFNETAQAQEKTEQVPVYYESNEVNSIDDLVIGNIYQFNGITPTNPNNSGLGINILNSSIVPSSTGIGVYSTGNVYLYPSYSAIDNRQFTFVFNGIVRENIASYLLDSISITQSKVVKEYTEVTTSMSIADSMSYAWVSVWQNDLFSWSYDSFLTTPFQYIGSVFGIPNDNTLYYCLSYWLDISIIWLCFDLVMYVPLLVHRWLDKGVLE